MPFPERKDTICAPADPQFDGKELEALAKATGTEERDIYWCPTCQPLPGTDLGSAAEPGTFTGSGTVVATAPGAGTVPGAGTLPSAASVPSVGAGRDRVQGGSGRGDGWIN
jgi:hypothetical protein